ncbi:MAG TPA: terminase family protein [Bryobacteraceae bacterium]|nr:terminase family protein [Bryobacteraceae bacterium]
MTALQSPESVAAFHAALAHFPSTAGPVCPDVPAPSAWAAAELQFIAEPKQTEALDSAAPRLAVRAARQWGKSTLLAIKALHTAVFHPGASVLVLALSARNAALFAFTLRRLAARLGHARRTIPGMPHSLVLPNGSTIRVESRAIRSTGLTGPATVILVDGEDPALPVPALLRQGGTIWFFATPNGEAGFFYDLWHNEAFNHWTRLHTTVDDVPTLDPAYIDERTRLSPWYVHQDLYAGFVPPPV